MFIKKQKDNKNGPQVIRLTTITKTLYPLIICNNNKGYVLLPTLPSHLPSLTSSPPLSPIPIFYLHQQFKWPLIYSAETSPTPSTIIETLAPGMEERGEGRASGDEERMARNVRQEEKDFLKRKSRHSEKWRKIVPRQSSLTAFCLISPAL